MPEVPHTVIVDGPPSQTKPDAGAVSVPHGSLPSPNFSSLMYPFSPQLVPHELRTSQ